MGAPVLIVVELGFGARQRVAPCAELPGIRESLTGVEQQDATPFRVFYSETTKAAQVA